MAINDNKAPKWVVEGSLGWSIAGAAAGFGISCYLFPSDKDGSRPDTKLALISVGVGIVVAFYFGAILWGIANSHGRGYGTLRMLTHIVGLTGAGAALGWNISADGKELQEVNR